MPPKKGRTRAAQHHAQTIIQSDYDTDNLTDMASSTPAPLPPRTNEELNLSVMRRHDPSVHQILSVAPFAVVYLFSPTTQQWEKCGVEGTLFVCSLAPSATSTNQLEERYSVTVLNRKGLDNFSSELLSSDDVDVTDEYVILQIEDADGTPRIYGLWIFSEPEPSSTAQTRVVNALIIQECAMRAENSRVGAGGEEEGGVGQFGGVGQQDEEVYEEVQGPEVQDGYGGPVRHVDVNDLFGQPPPPPPLPQSRPQWQEQEPLGPAHFFQQASQAPQQQGIPKFGQQNAFPQMAPQQTQQDVLGDLFRSARTNYSG